MNKFNKIGIVLIVLAVIFTIIGSTFAYWSWQTNSSQLTQVTFTIAGGFTCGADGGGNISSNDISLAPAACTNSNYAIKRTVNVSTTQRSGATIYLDMNLKVNSISANLAASQNFKYALTTSSTSCESGIMAEGTFYGAEANDELPLLTNERYTASTNNDSFYLWIWLDKEETDNNTQNGSFEFTLSGECTDQEPAKMYAPWGAEVDQYTRINFAEISSASNGQGLYLFQQSERDTNPIYYYRGNVSNNNVLFGDVCWKIVRTTETGGVKLIYNGMQTGNYTIITNTGNFTWDPSDNTWNATITDGENKEISFNVPAGEEYTFVLAGTTGPSTGGSYILYKDGSVVYSNGGGGGQALNCSYNYGTLTASNVIKFEYQGTSTPESPITFKIKMTHNGEALGSACNNTGEDTQLASTTAFNSLNNNNTLISPAKVGYMYGASYDFTTTDNNFTFNSYNKYGNRFIYSGGTYTLVDMIDLTNNWDQDYTSLNNHHYTCLNTTGTCTTLYYMYYTTHNSYRITIMPNDKSMEQLLDEMLINPSNTNSSSIKTVIDTWYTANLASSENNLEDTVWCNDRSISSLGGFDPNGGSTYGSTEDYSLLFKPYERTRVLYYPRLTCKNINDSFTKSSSNGNGSLSNPVGLLTVDEVMLAGGKNQTENSTYYLYNGKYYWLISPFGFLSTNANGWYVSIRGKLNAQKLDGDFGVRPAISLKPGGTWSGEGTADNPYTVSWS